MQPLILGGGQQNGMRSGTDNVPGIAGLGVAARDDATRNSGTRRRSICTSSKNGMAEGLSRDGRCGDQRNACHEKAHRISISVSFLGIRSEVLASYLGGQRHLRISRKRLLQP